MTDGDETIIERVPARLSHFGGGRAVLNTGEVIPLPRPIRPELEGKRTMVIVHRHPDGRRTVRVSNIDTTRQRPVSFPAPRRRSSGSGRRPPVR